MIPCKKKLALKLWLPVCCIAALICPHALAADISQASQISAVYNPSDGMQSIYYDDLSGHLNEIVVSGDDNEVAHYDLTALNGLPTITSPTVSAVYDSANNENLIFYLSGTSTSNVVMVTENGDSGSATASYPSANNFLVGGVAEPANRWQSVWAAVDNSGDSNSGDVDFGLQIINGQDDPDAYGPRGYVFAGGVAGHLANQNINIYKKIGRDPEHVQQQVHLFYAPDANTFVVAWDPEGQGHIHIVEFNPATQYYHSEDLMNTTSSTHMDDTTSASGGDKAVCTPSGFSFATNGTDAELYYYGGDGYLHEITSLSAGNWGSRDISKSAGSPPSLNGCGPISSVYNSPLQKTEVLYTSLNSSTPSGFQLNVLVGTNLDDNWTLNDEVQGAGSPINATPMSSTTDKYGYADTFYIGKDSSGNEHLYNLVGNTSISGPVVIGN